MKKKKVNFLVLFILVFFSSIHVLADSKPRSWIGIEFNDITDEFIKANNLKPNTPKNIIIVGVVKTSAADEAKIIPGDIILSVNNLSINKTKELIDYLKKTQAGDIINTKIYRNGVILNKKIKLKKYPDSNFKPEWVEGSKKLKSEYYFLENTLWSKVDDLLFPKYHGDKLKKYKSGPIIVCVDKNNKNNVLKLYDEIVSINGNKVGSFVKFKNQPVKVTVKRNNKLVNLTVNPTVMNLMNIRHNCTDEYIDFDCAMDYFDTWKLPKEKRGRGWKKTLECLKDYPIVPYTKMISKDNSNLKMDTIFHYLGWLQYDDPKKDLDKINEILELAKLEIKKFEEFQNIYPNHKFEKPYNDLISGITRATAWAAGAHSDKLKSTKNDTIKIDQNTVKITKAALAKIIKNKGINSEDAIKFLTTKKFFFEKANEQDYLLKRYLEAKENINWQTDKLDKYFDRIYYGLANFYINQRRMDEALRILDQGITIVKRNYENLYFKNAYSELLTAKAYILLIQKPYELINESNDFQKDVEEHFSNLENLSKPEKKKMLEIDKSYYTKITYLLYLNDLTVGKDKNIKHTYYPEKAIQFIKTNKNYSFDYEYMGSLSQLLQGSIIEDDVEKFNFANNELAIYFSTSQGSQKKLNAIRGSSTLLLSSYETNGFYKESDNLIQFMQDTFTLDEEIASNQLQSETFIMYRYYSGQVALRNNNFNIAKSIYEKAFELTKPSLTSDLSKYNLSQVFILSKFVPELYEIYFKEKNYKNLQRLNKIYINRDLSNIKKKDLKLISNSLGPNAHKIFKVLLNYFNETSNKKKFKLVKSHILKNINKTLKTLKNKKLLIEYSTNEDLVLRELAEIGRILISNSYIEDGKEILDKIQPKIINYYEEKSSANIWRPNIEDNVFGFIYLDVAEKYLSSDASFVKKAYKIAQIGKNTFTSRDLNLAIKNKKFEDPKGLISQYESIKRQLSVNLRSSQFAPKELSGNLKISEQLNNQNRDLQVKMTELEKEIAAKIPSYFKITKTQTAKVSDIKKILKKNEILLDYYFYNNDLKVVSISSKKLKILSKESDFKTINKISTQIRETLIPSQGELKPFDVKKSFDLNNQTFLFLNKITNKFKNIIVIPDGPLNSMPLHALATKNAKSCMDCTDVSFNLNNYTFNYYPSVESLISIDSISDDYKKTKYLISNETLKKTSAKAKDILSKTTDIKPVKKLIKDPLKKLKEKISDVDLKDKKKKVKNDIASNFFYLGIGDPDLYTENNEITKVDQENKISMLRSLFESKNIEGDVIKEIYGPVNGSSDEITKVSEYFLPLKSKIMLKSDATEINFKNLDLTIYKIIHFATHGEISGALTGVNEPFLVMSPPNIDTSNEDGLLTMSEIMSLETNADLVVLSACNTASGDETVSEGFSGLAKSFFMSGSKSILVSNWYVETYSAKEIVIGLFKNIKDKPDLTISQALNLTMLDMSQNQKNRSHPMFWAPFVVVGKNKSISIN